MPLPTYLNDFARGTDHELTIRMRDRPEHTIQLTIAASLVDTLYSIRQRQEELRREEEEAARAEKVTAEIDTLCQVIEGLKDGVNVSSANVFMALQDGEQRWKVLVEVEPFLKKNKESFTSATMLLRSMCRSESFRQTYSLLDGLVPDLETFVQVCTEVLYTGTPATMLNSEFKSLWSRMLPGGKTVFAVRVKGPFLLELRNVGVSPTVAEGVWDAAAVFRNWAQTLTMGESSYPPQRDTLLPRLMTDISAKK